jgi:hypothetical protein
LVTKTLFLISPGSEAGFEPLLCLPFLNLFVTGYDTVRGADNFRRIPGVSHYT